VDGLVFEYPDDVARIVRVMREAGHHLTPQEANEVWDVYSGGLWAGWLELPDSASDLEAVITDQLRKLKDDVKFETAIDNIKYKIKDI